MGNHAVCAVQAQFEADTQLHEISVTLLEGVKLDYPGPFAQAANASLAIIYDDPGKPDKSKRV